MCYDMAVGADRNKKYDEGKKRCPKKNGVLSEFALQQEEDSMT